MLLLYFQRRRAANAADLALSTSVEQGPVYGANIRYSIPFKN